MKAHEKCDCRNPLFMSDKVHNRLIESIVLTTIIFAAILLYFYYNDALTRRVAISILVCWMIPISIELSLHFEYYKYGKGLRVCIDEYNKIVSYCKDGFKKSITFDDIVAIEVHMTFTKYYNNSRSFPYSYYYYGKIIFKNEPSIIITRLMTDDIEEQLSKIEHIELKKEVAIYPSINNLI